MINNIRKWFTRSHQVFSKIGDILYYIFMAVVVASLLSFGYDKLDGGYGNIFGYKPILIETGSMEPAIKTKSIIIGKAIDGGEVKEGDIISYKLIDDGQEKIITHRAVYVSEENQAIHTKGDSNNIQDLYDSEMYPYGLPMENVLYRIDYIFNGVSPIIQALTSSYVAPVMAVAGVAGFIIIWRLLVDLLYDEKYEWGKEKYE